MRKIRFASFTWLLIIPIFAIVKVIWELYTPNTNSPALKPEPLAWLDTHSPVNLFISIGIILLGTYITFAYINAYIRRQTTYAIALYYGVLMLISYTPELTSSLIAIILFMNSILQLLSLDEKKKGVFIAFDTGFIVGIALLFDLNMSILALGLSLFLFLIRLSFRHFLQYWAGVVLPMFMAFPILYFLGLHTEWQYYFQNLLTIHFNSPALVLIDYILISLLVIFYSFQALQLYRQKFRKPSERLLLYFLFVYFILSLLVGVFAYPISGCYILFIIPSSTILYSLSKHENHKAIVIQAGIIIAYVLWNTSFFDY